MTTAATPNPVQGNAARIWALVPVLLLTLLVAVQLILVRMALHDPSFSIEDRYYAKALSWDARRAQDAQNQRLGWHPNMGWSRAVGGFTELTLSPTDAALLPLSSARIGVEAFAIARSGNVVAATFVERASGRYHASLPTGRDGLWELALTVTRGTDRFTWVERIELPRGGGQ